MQRDNAIDAVKGFAILLVMVGHCIVLNGLDRGDPYLYDAIKAVQMPLFMTVSGVLAGMSMARKSYVCGVENDPAACRQEMLTDFWRTLKKRAVSYLIPFFSWFVIVFLATHLADGDIGIGLFFRQFQELLWQTDRGLWFLMTLFVITVSVLFAQLVADLGALMAVEKQWNKNGRRMAWFLIVTGGIYCMFFLQGRSSFQFLSPSLTVQYMPFYVLGYLLYGFVPSLTGRLHAQGRGRFVYALWAVWGIMAACFVWLVAAYDLTEAPDGPAALLLQMTASFLGTYVCYFVICRLVKKRGFLSFIGMYTLEIYVLHFRFARLLHLQEKNLTLYSAAGVLWLLAAFALMSLCTAVCIFFIKKVWILDFLLFAKRRGAAQALEEQKRPLRTSSDKNTG